MTEKQIENTILEYLNFLPECIAWKNQSIGIWDPVRKAYRKPHNKWHINGSSDILGIYKQQFLAIEVNAPKNRSRPKHQKQFIEMIKVHGGIAGFCSSIEDVEDLLDRD